MKMNRDMLSHTNGHGGIDFFASVMTTDGAQIFLI